MVQTRRRVHHPDELQLCSACNRIRIAADGRLYPCLMDKPVGTLLPAIRPRFDPRMLDAIIAGGLAGKRDEHPHDGHAIRRTSEVELA